MCDKMEYDELLKQYKRFQIELDEANQALYDCRRQVKTTQTLETEYQEDIRALQIDLEAEKQKCAARLQQQEDSNASARTAWNDRVSYLEKEVESKEEEVIGLKKQLFEVIKLTEGPKPKLDDTLFEEFSHLKAENVELSEHIAELEKSVEHKDNENAALQSRNKQLEEELNLYKEILESKREELKEANILNQNLKDDLLCAQSELENVKSRPLDDQSKGNSLFAEVDDRRVVLQKSMKEMKTRYLEMKREHSNLVNQITSLRKENTELITLQKSEIKERKFEEEVILDTYKNQIQILNELVESYKKELEEKLITGDPATQGIQYFDKLLSMKNAEIESWRQKSSTRSLNYTSMSYDLAEANRQLTKCNLEILRLKNEIGSLRTQIQEMELKSPTETAPPTEDKVTNSIVKCVTVDRDEENPVAISKRVQFTESTLEPQVTDRVKLRKGAKLLISKPVKYS